MSETKDLDTLESLETTKADAKVESKGRKTSKSKTKAKKETAKYDDASYEENLKMLTEIVERLESKELALDKLIAEYQEGMQIIKVMQEQLLDAKEIIEASGIEETIATFEEDVKFNNAQLGLDPTMSFVNNQGGNPGSDQSNQQGFNQGNAMNSNYGSGVNTNNNYNGYNRNNGFNGGNGGNGGW